MHQQSWQKREQLNDDTDSLNMQDRYRSYNKSKTQQNNNKNVSFNSAYDENFDTSSRNDEDPYSQKAFRKEEEYQRSKSVDKYAFNRKKQPQYSGIMFPSQMQNEDYGENSDT